MTDQPPSPSDVPPAPPWAPAPPSAPETFAPPPPIATPSIPSEPLNPWVSLWTRPRATMRQILDTNPRRWVHVLAILGGIAEFIITPIPDTPPFPQLSPSAMLAFKCVSGAIGGLIGLYIASFLGWMTGRWLGGQGNLVEVRSASAWPNILTLWSTLLWLPLVVYLGMEAVNFNPEALSEEPTGMVLFATIRILLVVAAIWRLVVYLKCLAEAHRFSAWHALGASLIGVVLIGVVVAILVGIVIGIVGLSAFSS